MERNEAIESLRQLYIDTNEENKAALECLIPELKESEDERTRKELIEFILYKAGLLIDEETEHKFVAYLEKQKEQSFTHHEVDESLQSAVTHQMEDDGDVDDFVRKGIDDIALKYAELGAKWQKEQKSELCDMGRWDEESYNNGIHSVLQNPEAYGLTKQEPAGWSEEDFELIVGELVQDVIANEKDAANYGDSKKPTSFFVKKYIDRLKSLRPQPHWKPSEEQMEALKSYAEDSACLDELYDILKKL